ncbi:MAG: DUF3990 domain-containing protein [Clostridia bacterium]|nr:DUF3990 domain-containing protein [Clostridia bacterium]
MKLYHGSNTEIEDVNLSKSAVYKEFGDGFYTTAELSDAWRFAKRKAALSGWNPVVTVFDAPDGLLREKELNIRVFGGKPRLEWAVFVKNNRDREYAHAASAECNLDRKHDVVIGPIMDDDLALIIRTYSNEFLGDDYLKEKLPLSELPVQYSFHTERGLGRLKKTGVLYE